MGGRKTIVHGPRVDVRTPKILDGKTRSTSSRYSTLRLLRFPLVLGGIIAGITGSFYYRKFSLHEEILEARKQNEENYAKNAAIFERAKEVADSKVKLR